MNGWGTGDFQGSEAILSDAMRLIHIIIHLSKPSKMDPASEPDGKVWTLGDDHVSVWLHPEAVTNVPLWWRC